MKQSLIVSPSPIFPVVCSLFTQAVRHRVLKWAPFVFCIIIIFFGGGSTSGLMLIGWHAANMSTMSSGEERNVGQINELCFAKFGSADCLLKRSYHVQMHTAAAVDPH